MKKTQERVFVLKVGDINYDVFFVFSRLDVHLNMYDNSNNLLKTKVSTGTGLHIVRVNILV